jgi:hypothetical protein
MLVTKLIAALWRVVRRVWAVAVAAAIGTVYTGRSAQAAEAELM